MRDWHRTGTGVSPVPVRRDHHHGKAPSARARATDDSLTLRQRIPDFLVGAIVLLLIASAGALALVPAQVPAAAEPALLAAPEVPVTLARPVVAAGSDPEAPPPSRVRIDRIGVDSDLIGLRVLADNTLEVPADYDVAGWHRAGTAPGNTGPAVLVGHVDSFEGPAVFFRLRELQPGEPVVVTRADGSEVTFDVVGVERYAKADFPTEAVYGATAGPELRLLTCGGAFDEKTRSYTDNVVVYARQAGVPASPPAPGPAERRQS